MYLLYNLTLGLVLIAVFLPYALPMLLLERGGIRRRLGLLSSEDLLRLRRRDPIWIHAASVGEVSVLASVLAPIQRVCPERAIIISTFTPTGLARARRALKNVDLFTLLPLDFHPIVQCLFQKIAPRSLLLAETEIWPTLIHIARRAGCRIGLLNGKISERGAARYRFAGSLFHEAIQSIDLLALQSPEVADRFLQLGARPERVNVTGNLKFDVPELRRGADRSHVRRSLGLSDERKIIVAGSTRDKEEEILLRAWEKLRRHFGDLTLILAPRHLSRIGEVERLGASFGQIATKRSRISKDTGEADLILLDTMGELTSLYAAADAAFVGGSFVPIGGHNPMEPAAANVPVLFGPHMRQEGADLLLRAGAAISVKDEDELTEQLEKLLRNPAERRRRGQAGVEIIARHRGMAQATVDLFVEAGVV